MNKKVIQKQVSVLQEFITHHKQQKIAEVLSNRTKHICIVLEDIYQPHNASATIRTCDCLGVQNVHIIENRNEFSPSTQVMQGAGKWITLHRYNDNIQSDTDISDPSSFPSHNTEACIKELKEQGYQLIATTPEPPLNSPLPSGRGERAMSERGEVKSERSEIELERGRRSSLTLNSLDLSKPTAFLFGTEAHGLTQRALEMADGYLKLPMYGFTQSYNISVSVAITLSHSIKRLHADIDWHLSEDEKAELKLSWYKKCVKNADQLLKNIQN